jgi:mannose-binding lectin 1
MAASRRGWDGHATLCVLGILLLVTNAQNPNVGVPASDATGQAIHRRFEYKYSFKPPYLAQKDGTVPFFEYSGNAIASEESVRITPSLRSQKGMIWSRLMTAFDWWEVELQFRVTGRGRIGADGLAFWYTATKGYEGPVFGSSDKWNGLGVFFDSFDNDNKHNNPYVMAMANDGNSAYDHQKDGSTQQLAGCLRDFRNKPFPVRAKIEYYRNTLTLLFHNGMSNNEKDYEMCMRVENVNLPKNGYFGISAATGGLADDHDVLRFSVSSLRSPEMALVTDNLDDPDSQKFEAEFEQYQEKLKVHKETWAKDNPVEAAKKTEMDDWENWFSDQDKELQQIYQGQSAMKDVLQDLHRKMDEIIGRQERTLSVISSVSSCAFSSRPQKISSIFGLAFFVGCRSGVIDRWCIWRRPASNTN